MDSHFDTATWSTCDVSSITKVSQFLHRLNFEVIMKIYFVAVALAMSGCLVGTQAFARPSSNMAKAFIHSMVANPVDAPSKSQVSIHAKLSFTL